MEEFIELLNKKCQERDAFRFYDENRKYFRILDLMARKIKFEEIQFKKVNLTLNKMQNLALQFFDELDVDLNEKIWGVLEDVKNVLRPHQPKSQKGVNAVGLENGRVAIDLAPSNDTDGLVIVAHEFGHLLEERNQKKIAQRTDCIGEIAPIFVERLYCDWLLKNKIIDKNDYEMQSKKREQAFAHNVSLLLEEDEIIRRLGNPMTKENYLKFEDEFKGSKKYEVLKRRVDVMINGEGANKNIYGERMFRYVVAEVVGAVLYEDYKKDSALTLERFKSFLDTNAHLTLKQGASCLLGENFASKLQSYCDAKTEGMLGGSAKRG